MFLINFYIILHIINFFIDKIFVFFDRKKIRIGV